MSRFNCNVHHITIKPETDSLIIEFADVFKGLEKVEGKYINQPTSEHKISYSSTQKSTPHKIT